MVERLGSNMHVGPILGGAVALLAAMTTSFGPAYGAGALAIGRCDRHGYSYDYPSSNAALTRALVECASEGDRTCQLVSEIAGGCAAFAVSGTCGPRGWGTASSRPEAEALALGFCRQYGGGHCTIRRWVCDGGN